MKLTKNTWQSISQSHFRHATDGSEAMQATQLALKFDDDFLYVKFICENNPFTQQNDYTEYNADLWNQEVLELFISDELEQPIHYLEFEINPNNAIWVGRIHNPSGLGHIYADTVMIPYEQTGIVHEVEVGEGQWSGSFQIPFSLIGKKQHAYRFNFYRIVSLKPQTQQHWAGTPNDCAYTCLYPTMSGESPAFHRTEPFGLLELVEDIG